MEKRIKIIFGLISIFLILLIFIFSINAIQITTFSNSLTSENLTFTGNENITRYLEIPKNANVTNAVLNLSGYKIENIETFCVNNLTLNNEIQTLDGNHNYDCIFIINGSILYINDSGMNLTLNATYLIKVDSTSKIDGNRKGFNGAPNPLIDSSGLDRPFMVFHVDGNFSIEHTFVVNKKVKECSIISGDGFQCEVITDNSVKMILKINDTDFFDKVFLGEMSITSDADPNNLEIKRISLVPRVYNFSYRVLGIPAMILLIIFGALILLFSIFFIMKGRIRKKLKRRKS